MIDDRPHFWWRRHRRWYRSPKRLGVVLLVIGGAAILAVLPFSYGDGGSRATPTASPVAASLSIGGLALLLIGACFLGIPAIQRWRRRSRDHQR
jgi:peptidoglycan/LPS O-acetylase OafA/YrhL